MRSRIKAVRKSLGLSQRAFGEKLGVSRDVINNIELGRVEPKGLFLQHFCEQYNINEDWLNTGEGDMFLKESKPDDPVLNEAVNIFKNLRPEFQEYALEQIKKLSELQKK